MKKNDMKLWIVGSIGIDDIKTRTEDRKDLLGGSLPFCTAAASFFTQAGAVGIVGSDFPESFAARWGKFGTDLSGVQHAAGKTFRWAGAYDENMIERETLKTELGVFADFKPKLPAAYKQAPFVLLGNIQPELQMHVLRQAKGAKFVALDTMNLWIDIAKPALVKVIKKVDLLTVNDGEARMLSGKWNMRECADELLKMGPSYVIIKRGEHGAILFSKKGIFVAPAFPVEKVVDPTGAGDSYAGTFMGYLAKRGRVSEKALREALLYASVVASFGVEGFSLECFEKLTIAKIERRMKQMRKMISV
ncbi:MAG: PfkB family carbohydrate kinase [Kiritimatiellae bacterium]|jgi:sugar/nucleoside kinase (ribokinase family)|nr:PfkB family carbohydrate kinase [Kiritimatiellia bacterium]